MKKLFVLAACIAGLCGCSKADVVEQQEEPLVSKAAKGYLDVTIRFSFVREKGGDKVGVYPLFNKSIWVMIPLEGWVYSSQAWVSVSVPGQVTPPRVDNVSFTLEDVYVVNESTDMGYTGRQSVSVDFPTAYGVYSEFMPIIQSQSTYIDITSLRLTPDYLNTDYVVRWHSDNLPMLDPSTLYPDPDPDPEPTPDPGPGEDSLLRGRIMPIM